MEDDTSMDVEETEESEVYLPNKGLGKDEQLVCDESAYIMLHQAHFGKPCLSFDLIQSETDSNDSYPMSMHLVAGTQASRANANSLLVVKLFNIHKTSSESPSDGESDSSNDAAANDNERLPSIASVSVPQRGCINRVRSSRVGGQNLVAIWSEIGSVSLWVVDEMMNEVDETSAKKSKNSSTTEYKPTFTFNGHQTEGFAVDWSTMSKGVLATGDCRRDIHIWQPTEAGKWSVDQRPLVGHTASVEDLQWSPTEKSVLASCSVDRSIRIWDCRAPPTKACMLSCLDAHESDVNVIAWNRLEPFIASGGDDGALHIWDLRLFETNKPVASLKHHTSHISTVEWHPTDSTVLASGGADDQIAIWDLAIEKDDENNLSGDLSELPPQLLFVHQGQKDIKELHWHPQHQGVMLSTAHSGFNIFRTISV